MVNTLYCINIKYLFTRVRKLNKKLYLNVSNVKIKSRRIFDSKLVGTVPSMCTVMVKSFRQLGQSY